MFISTNVMFTETHVNPDNRQWSDLQDANNFLFFVEALSSDKDDKSWFSPSNNSAIHNEAALLCATTTANHNYDNDTDSSSSGDPFPNYQSTTNTSDDRNVSLLNGQDYASHCFAVKHGKSERRYTCSICQKEFKRRSSLSTHKLIHANIKPFQCPTCNKEFLRRSDLKKHMLMHTGQKPHRCMECGKEFSQSSNMLTHMRRHSGVRPFACQICGHAFFRKVDVRRHQYRHVREKSLSSTSSVE